jgi:nucleoside-diphosphate-sugar epimerase
LRFLFLGGTAFLGRAAVEAAVGRSHEATLFTRGQTNPELFPELERVHGDRATDPLPDGEWDAVIDTSGYVPEVVRRSADALESAVGRYLFVSSVSVYRDFTEGPTEDSPRMELGELPDDRLLQDYSNYGALKALSEDILLDAYGDRALIVRPGLIVGPHDPTGRFTYWPHRVARGGEFIVPGPAEAQVQFVDARDLGAWLVELCERGESGPFNATHPGVTWHELVESCLTVSGSDSEPVWVDGDWLAEQEVGEWMELPLWLHDPEWVGMNKADVGRALAAGLIFRPLDDTVRGALELAATSEDAGLNPEREAELLEAWRAG